MTGVHVRPTRENYHSEAELQPPQWTLAIVGGAAAAMVTALGMQLVRSLFQVRSIPERLLEWSLLFIPLDVFEASLQRFGFSAKRYALYFAIVIMLVLLAALGTVALRRRWSIPILLGVGIGLWLFIMLVIMPLTSAGIFATALIEGNRITIVSHFAVALLFAAVLAVARVLLAEYAGEYDKPEVVVGGAGLSARRSALAMLGGTLGAFAFTGLLEALVPHRTGLPSLAVADPQEPVPSGGLEPPSPHPNVVPTPSSAGNPPTTAPTAAPAVAAKPTAAAAGLPVPTDARSLPRDQDGAVLSTARRPGELSPFITTNDVFYIVTKNAGGDPIIQPNDWRMVIDGEVAQSFELDYGGLRRLPSVEITKTMECISNLVDQCELAPFGCDLISNARWRGVRLSEIFSMVGGVRPGVTHVATISADEYTTALPIDLALSDEALLIYEMNGEVLPREHGYPARILVPGRYGMKNAKWVVALRPMRREFIDWYGQRAWSREAVVKTMTRIDVPARGSRVSPGQQRIAGIAYAGDRGIEMVEYSVDGGETWTTADLLEPPAEKDVWVRWEGTFTALAGEEMTVVARATDGGGALQPEPFSLAQPDGASGWNHVTVRGA